MRPTPLSVAAILLLVSLPCSATITVNITAGPCSQTSGQVVRGGLNTSCGSFPITVGSLPDAGGTVQQTMGDGNAGSTFSAFAGDGTCTSSCATTPTMSAGGTYNLTVSYSGGCVGVVVPNNYCWGGCFTNDTGGHICAHVIYTGGINGSGDGHELDQGQVACETRCTTNGPIFAGWSATSGTCTNPQAPFYVYPPSYGFTNVGGGNTASSDNKTASLGTPPPGSTGGPTWTPGSGGSTNLANQQDIKNLTSAIANGLGTVDAKLDVGNANTLGSKLDLDAIKSDLDAANAIASGGTNLMGSINGNFVGQSNVLSDILTNSIQQGFWSRLGSNAWYMGGSPNDLTNAGSSGLQSSMTNGPAATNAAMTQLGTLPTSLDSITNSFGSGPTIGAGSSTGLSFSFCGFTLNLDPENWCPGISAYIKAAWTVLILYFFAMSVGRLLFECAQSFASAQTGGVPNFMAEIAGFGGNVVGWIVAALIPVAMIAIWKIVFDWVLGGAIANYLSQVGTGLSGGFGYNGNQIALYLLNETFPITLFFGVVITRLTMQFVAAKVIIIASAASRFLTGH